MSSKKPERLRLQLLRWVLGPLLVLLLVNAWSSHRAAASTADMAFDRLLMASAEAIAEDVEFKDGGIAVDLPYAALELLESNLQERIFYRVVAPDGRTATGYDDLPLPGPSAASAAGTESAFYTARYRGEEIHLVALPKPLYGAQDSAPVLVVVAETGEARDALSRRILLEGLVRQALLIAVAGLLVAFGLHRGLRPLVRLRTSMMQRAASDLRPIEADNVPAEVQPLIDALNQHTARIERMLKSRQQLIADASHQMRTPLAEMRTQIEYSLREGSPALLQQTLVDVHGDIDRLSRLMSQLLLLARSDPDALVQQRMASLDLGELARQVTLEHVAAARKRVVDLSFEAPPGPAPVQGNELLLRELVANLVDNAIRYGREGGSVAVRVAGDGGALRLAVEDDGPGIAEAERDKVFERFYRSPAAAAAHVPGSGLGLSIVRDIAAGHGAEVRLSTSRSGGLCASVSLPRAAAT